MWLRWILGLAAVICGIIALAKKHAKVASTIVGLVLTLLSWTLPYVLAEQYAECAAESAGNALKTTMELTNGF